MRVGLRYDMRSLSDAERSARYRAVLDQCAWAESAGFDYVRLNEHHGAEDGYLPSPLVAAAAIGARTSRLTVRVTVLLLPLHDPLRVAEDIAVADHFCGGRLEVVFGAGYVPREFEMFGRAIADRVALLESGIQTLRQAWTGEPFEYRGTRVRVTPRPAHGSMSILLGGSSRGAARRAARIADGFEPSTAELGLAYEHERARLGRRDGEPHARPTASGVMRFLHVANDPAVAWQRILPFALREMRSYGQWSAESTRSTVIYPPVTSPADLEASGIYRVMTPEQCITHAHSLRRDDSLELHPLMGGMPVELGWESLRVFGESVLPEIRPVS